jgi:hypothetical protein
VYLAQHGWDLTGIDMVPRAITEAATKAAAAGVHPTLVVGGISHLTELITVPEYALVLDVACFHGLPAGQRHETAGQITQVTKSGAVFLHFSFGPGHRGPLPHCSVRCRSEALSCCSRIGEGTKGHHLGTEDQEEGEEVDADTEDMCGRRSPRVRTG